MNLYKLRVELWGNPEIYRIIEATGNCMFDDLHNAIFEAFDRDDEHLYSFFLTGKKMTSTHKIYASPEITHPMAIDGQFEAKEKEDAYKTRLEDSVLSAKEFLYYLFDFGDEWWHQIRVESITGSPSKKKSIKIVEKVGDSPSQYECEEDDWDEEES